METFATRRNLFVHAVQQLEFAFHKRYSPRATPPLDEKAGSGCRKEKKSKREHLSLRHKEAAETSPDRSCSTARVRERGRAWMESWPRWSESADEAPARQRRKPKKNEKIHSAPGRRHDCGAGASPLVPQAVARHSRHSRLCTAGGRKMPEDTAERYAAGAPRLSRREASGEGGPDSSPK